MRPAWPTRASVGSETRTRSDPSDEPSEPNLGRPQDSRRTAHTRYEHRRDQREQVHGPSPEAAIADRYVSDSVLLRRRPGGYCVHRLEYAGLGDPPPRHTE